MCSLQPCEETRQKQISMWIKCILDYCKNSGFTEVNIETFPLFENKSIGSILVLMI